MGSMDGANTTPTVVGIAKKSVNAHAITTESTGTAVTRSSTAASIALPNANVNATPSMDKFAQLANVGRERGRESPIPVSPAIERLTGRNAAFQKLCTVINWVPTQPAAPRIPYCRSRAAVASAITPTTTPSKPATTALAPTARTAAPRAML